MALPGFRNHPKFRRLVAALHMPEAHVLGHVEMMWEVCYENGNAVLGDVVDVELAAGWVGESGAFCRALLECGGKTRPGLIDEIENGVFQVHDLLDHAPDYVVSRRKRLDEKGKDKICAHCGASFRTSDPKSRFCSDACRKLDWRARHKDVGTEGNGDADATNGDEGIRRTCVPATNGDERGRRCDAASDHYQPSPDQPRSTTTTTTLLPTPEPLPYPTQEPAPESSPQKKTRAKRGHKLQIALLEMPAPMAQAFGRIEKAWPKEGWNFATKTTSPRKTNLALAADRFKTLCDQIPIAGADGGRLSPAEIADATIAWLEKRQREAGKGVPPCVPCIENFFSADPASKRHWQNALVEFFGIAEEAS